MEWVQKRQNGWNTKGGGERKRDGDRIEWKRDKGRQREREKERYEKESEDSQRYESLNNSVRG